MHISHHMVTIEMGRGILMSVHQTIMVYVVTNVVFVLNFRPPMDSQCPPNHPPPLLPQRDGYGLHPTHFAFRTAPPFHPFPHAHFAIPPNAIPYPPRTHALPLLTQGAATNAHFVGSFIHQPIFHNPRAPRDMKKRPSKRARQRMKKRMYVEDQNRGESKRKESNHQASESGYETTGDCQTPKKTAAPNNHNNTRPAKDAPLWRKAPAVNVNGLEGKKSFNYMNFVFIHVSSLCRRKGPLKVGFCQQF